MLYHRSLGPTLQNDFVIPQMFTSCVSFGAATQNADCVGVGIAKLVNTIPVVSELNRRVTYYKCLL